MTQKAATFQQNLEEAIIEYKKMACPDASCGDRIISKEKIITPTRSVVEYWCENPLCNYHKKAKIYRKTGNARPGPAPSANFDHPSIPKDRNDFKLLINIVLISFVLGLSCYLIFG